MPLSRLVLPLAPRRRAVLLPLLGALLLTPSLASAEPLDPVRGKEKYQAGAQAYREGRYKDAIVLFREANELDPHPEMLFNLAQAYEKLGDPASALAAYRQYLRFAPNAPDRVTVEAIVRNLEDRLRERGLQQVTVTSTPRGARVDLDGKPVGTTPWTGEIAPGRHVFVLHADGYSDVTREFAMSGDRAVDLDVILGGPPVTGAPLVPVVAPPPPPSSAQPRKVSPLTGVTLGVGLASFAVAIGLEVARASAESTARSDLTQVGYANDLSTMTTYQTAARVMAGVGAAVTVTGIVLLAVDLKAPAQANATPPSPGAPAAPGRMGATTGFGCFTGACGAVLKGSF